MWHNSTTRGLTGTKANVTDIWWATGADQLKGRTIDHGPYTGETWTRDLMSWLSGKCL
ncbi:hypothetical protein ACFWFI_06770 [Streptomyces sp. NPDC060209]|uniref:hypothetical protein n=1 Tax=Streptomyces sp. NPDC060209 TaxID=3347073 RepID=UPI003663012E